MFFRNSSFINLEFLNISSLNLFKNLIFLIFSIFFFQTSNVFRLDLPKHTVPFGRKIDPCEIPEDIDVGSCLRIFISEVIKLKSPYSIFSDNYVFCYFFADSQSISLLVSHTQRKS